MIRHKVEIDNKIHWVYGEKINGVLWYHWNGEVFSYVPEKRGRKATSTRSGLGVIMAPMPGKITKVLVKVLEFVKTRQPLVVMEAMKMEYTLEADCEGPVTELNCQAGDQVGVGEVLLKINHGDANEKTET